MLASPKVTKKQFPCLTFYIALVQISTEVYRAAILIFLYLTTLLPRKVNYFSDIDHLDLDCIFAKKQFLVNFHSATSVSSFNSSFHSLKYQSICFDIQ